MYASGLAPVGSHGAPMRGTGVAAVKAVMLQAASQRGILTEERLQAALKPGADLHQVRHVTPVHRPSA